MLIAMSMSICFASCGGDDDNNQDISAPTPGPGEGASELVGKWEDTYSTCGIGWGYELKANGSGIGFESNVSTDKCYGTWGIR